MKLSQLLSQRDALLLKARLANFAFAYVKLEEFAARIERARLTGVVCLKRIASEGEPTAILCALTGQQAVVEEHFTDEDINDLADVIGFILDGNNLEITFPIEELGDTFLGPLRREFEEHGIALDQAAPAIKKHEQMD